ncbi:hypothetical protein DAERI_010377 [Deinococcus aerius]|uniref:Uncharacterized protein n=1 Tax=Deinococcus aerius TaxID=200253 RepID=A0A2I9DUY6_9DEIO|nr:hypothetical protein DAERI_010377 [Deinococcus aerius]
MAPHGGQCLLARQAAHIYPRHPQAGGEAPVVLGGDPHRKSAAQKHGGRQTYSPDLHPPESRERGGPVGEVGAQSS